MENINKTDLASQTFLCRVSTEAHSDSEQLSQAHKTAFLLVIAVVVKHFLSKKSLKKERKKEKREEKREGPKVVARCFIISFNSSAAAPTDNFFFSLSNLKPLSLSSSLSRILFLSLSRSSSALTQESAVEAWMLSEDSIRQRATKKGEREEEEEEEEKKKWSQFFCSPKNHRHKNTPVCFGRLVAWKDLKWRLESAKFVSSVRCDCVIPFFPQQPLVFYSKETCFPPTPRHINCVTVHWRLKEKC